MNRRALGFLAITIIVLMGIVLFAGLDNLPRGLRNSAQAAVASVAVDRDRFAEHRAKVENAIAAEPELFRTRAAEWRQQLGRAEARFAEAAASVISAQKLIDANRREDRQALEREVARLNSLRTGALEQASTIRAEADRWMRWKQDLPKQLEAMRSQYEVAQAFDPAAAAPVAQKAMTDWPDKREDLQRRLDAVTALKQQAIAAYENTAAAREQAEARNWAVIDYPALFTASEKFAAGATQLRQGADAVNALASQLYIDRNKILLDLEPDESRQKVRVVETKFPDATLQNGRVTQQERWEPIGQGRAAELEKVVGMSIEHKAPGKYDSEAERIARPPEYAHIAPPGQANQYGSWNNGVWNWLPQYLILSQLLRGSGGPMIRTGDYYDYQRARGRGETWYGRRGEYRTPWGGSSYANRGSTGRRVLDALRRAGGNSSGGGWYTERPGGRSQPDLGPRGYSGSRYQSRGGYSGSRYQSRPGGFGSRSYSRGFGRSFGGRGRR